MTALLLAVLAGGASGAQPPPEALPELAAEVRELLRDQEYLRAIETLDAAGPRGSHPVLQRLRAEAQVGLLDYPAAVDALAGALPTADNLALRARLLAMLGRDEEARSAVEALFGLDELPSASARVTLAAQLRASGLEAEARRLLGPPGPGESAAAALERGRLALADDDYEDALPFLETAAAASDPPPGAAFELGRCLALLGRRAEAVRWLRRAAAEAPQDPAVRFRLGQSLAQDPDPALAAEGERVLAGYEESRLRARRRDLLLAGIHEADRDGWVELLGLLLDGGELEEAGRVAAAAAARFPADPAFVIGRARVRLESGDPPGAASILAPLVPPPGDPLEGASLSAARWLADARLRSGDPAAAARLFNRVLTAGGDRISPRIRAAAATASAMSGDPGRALGLFDQALRQTAGPARAALLADSALVLEMLARPLEAEARYREALALDPAHRASTLGLAELLLRAGRREEAAEVLRAALRLAPDDPALRELLSRAVSPAPPPDYSFRAFS